MKLDFIVGIEIRLSNNHTCRGRDGKPHPFYDICDELAGKYPKEFKFTGWHPHCRCIATTILKTEAEMEADDEAILRGKEPSDPGESENAVTELPDNFTRWVEENQDRIARATSLPYFLRDNESLIGNSDEGIAGTRLGNQLKSLLHHLTLKEDAAAEQAQTAFTQKQIKNHKIVSRAIGIEQGERMSFKDADSGNSNPHFSWLATALGIEDPYNTNCTIAVAAHELRLRGWNVTAMPFDINNPVMRKMFNGSLNAIWIDPATGMQPVPAFIDGKTVEKTMKRFESQTASVGRYHVRFNWDDGGGHVLCVDRLPSGELRFYDPQSNELNITDWINGINLDKGLRVTRVDNLLINPSTIAKIIQLR